MPSATFMRKWGAWIALCAMVAVVLAILVWPGGSPSAAERAQSLESELKCPECQGLSVADSQAPTSRAIRTDITKRIADGQSDEHIRQAYIDRYGESILLAPRSSGISLLVWVLPVLVLSLGATGIAFALARSRRDVRLHATAADESLVERARKDDA
jgi:cytochrome c-type biogenesis protein CcmH